MGDTRHCPFCAEPIKVAAVVCRFCNSRLDGKEPASFDPHRALHEGRAKKKAEAIATGEIPAAPPPPGPISSGSWTSIVITVVLAVPGLLVYALATDESDREGCLIVSLVFAGFAALFVLGFLIRDLTGPSPRKRFTPEAAAKAFYAAIRRRHYGRAWACVSPLDRTAETHSTLEIPVLSVQAKGFTFENKKPFGKYWRCQAGMDDRGIGGYHKGLKYEILQSEEIRPGVALVHVRFKVEGYPSALILVAVAALIIGVILMVVFRKEQSFEVRKVVYEKDGLWWMASGEFGDGEDAVLEELLRASPDRPA